MSVQVLVKVGGTRSPLELELQAVMVQLESVGHHYVGLERRMQPLLCLETGRIHLKFAWGEADGVASKWPGAWSLIAFSFHALLWELGPRARWGLIIICPQPAGFSFMPGSERWLFLQPVKMHCWFSWNHENFTYSTPNSRNRAVQRSSVFFFKSLFFLKYISRLSFFCFVYDQLSSF